MSILHYKYYVRPLFNTPEIIHTIIYDDAKLTNPSIFLPVNRVDGNEMAMATVIKRYRIGKIGSTANKLKREYRLCVPIGRTDGRGGQLEAHNDFTWYAYGRFLPRVPAIRKPKCRLRVGRQM